MTAARTNIAPDSLAITHARVVLEHEVLDDATVVVRDGRIASVATCDGAAPEADVVIDAAHELLLMPGLIDTHNDGLEAEVNPRPRVNFPGDFALRNYERRSIAGGVTTSFHAITFANMTRHERTIADAAARCDMIRDGRAAADIDHQVLHRLDVWTPEGVEPLIDSMRRSPVHAMSLNDHTPGQGQYRDLDAFKRMLAAYRADDPDFDPEIELRRRMESRAADVETVPAVLGRVHHEYRRAPFVLASHDDDSPERVEQMAELGATIAEFPVTFEAARRARDIGHWITVGAPNIVRGGSTSGNQDATELVAAGLADIICADYHAPSMLLSVFKLVDAGLCELPAAVAKVTANPARAFGLDGRGRLVAGAAADLALVELVHGTPVVQAVLRGGRMVYATARVQQRHALAATAAV